MFNIKKHFYYFILVVPLFFLCFGCSANPKTDLEESICGFKEPIVFWLWSSAAGDPDAARVQSISNVTDISLTTNDGRILRGYKLKSDYSDPTVGYILVAQGNAMLADQIVDDFAVFSAAGYDVYLFDYRGYGRSEGKRRLKAILSDYREIKDHLDSLGYDSRAFYGMSFGGVVLLDALKDDSNRRIVVIDSTPSRLSDYGCPPDHDPVENFINHPQDTLLLLGEKDKVVKLDDSKELASIAQKNDFTINISSKFGHPFMDGQTSSRMKVILNFLKARTN